MAARASSIGPTAEVARTIALLNGSPDRPVAFDGARAIPVHEFLSHVHGVAERLPAVSHVLNLCEGRYRFLVTWCAALVRGVPTLLPPSRAPAVILEMLERFPDAIAIGDEGCSDGIRLERLPPRYHSLPEPLPAAAGGVPQLAADLLAAIGFTSGSSGAPEPQLKRWDHFCLSTAHNARTIAAHLDQPGPAHLLATVPAQHMYGMETSVLLPLLGGAAIHSARPFFPADIAAALGELPAPRVLVTTPVHLRALVESRLPLPPLAVILCATAPLGQALARAAEAATGARLLEFFGSTETCVIGYRRSALDDAWTLHPSVCIDTRSDGALVSADWLVQPVLLQDLIETLPCGRFRLAGRASDHLEIAGKRASLGELTRRLLEIDGVQDAVVFQPDAAGPVQRVAALVVAPELAEAQLLAALRESIDPAFLPRPLRIVPRLPRNDTGKLPRQALLDALREIN
jgi:acyl-coenzyme A synthetase/AMP-(fatty) acid ligase